MMSLRGSSALEIGNRRWPRNGRPPNKPSRGLQWGSRWRDSLL